MIEVVTFDADDTLWHSETLFAVTQERYRELLAPYVDAGRLTDRLLEIERANLGIFGYGVKGFTLSMIETAIEVSGGRVSAGELATVLDWGKELMQHPVELLDGVADTLHRLHGRTRLALLTKGDLFHQESKIAASGLAELFEHVAIVNEKDEATYRRFCDQLRIAPAQLLMVGNSVRSDVLPVLAVGGRAVHVPYRTTWALEEADLPEDEAVAARAYTVADLHALPDLLDELEGRGRRGLAGGPV